jgi:hypothetical protein
MMTSAIRGAGWGTAAAILLCLLCVFCILITDLLDARGTHAGLAAVRDGAVSLLLYPLSLAIRAVPSFFSMVCPPLAWLFAVLTWWTTLSLLGAMVGASVSLIRGN